LFHMPLRMASDNICEMRSLLVLARIFLLLLAATVPRLSGAESARVQNWRRLSNDQFETLARGALTGTTAAKPSSIAEIAELCGEISKRGTNARAELHGLAVAAIRSMLKDPDLKKHSTLNDGISLWMTVMHDPQMSPLWAPTGEALRKLAFLTDDDELKKAFLEVSPAAPKNRAMTDRERQQSSMRHSTQRSVVFWLLSDRWIERQLARLQKDPAGPPLCPEFQGTVPDHIQALSPECVEAWKEAARLNAWVSLVPASGAAPPQGNWKRQHSDLDSPDFAAAFDRFFTAPAELSIAEFSRFYSNRIAFCGTGSEEMHKVRRRMLLMLHLRDRNLPAAVRASFHDRSGFGSLVSAWRGVESGGFEILELCGLNWEKLFSSALLPIGDRKDLGDIHSFSATELLADRGSNFGGKVLLATQKWQLQREPGRKSASTSSEGVRYVDARAIGRFITPGVVPPGSRPEIAPEIRNELVHVLIAELARERNPNSLGYVIFTLGELKRPELKEVIRPYVDSRFHEVADRAATAMTSLGEDTPHRKHASVGARFQIQINDTLWTTASEGRLQYKTEAAGRSGNHALSPEGNSGNELRFDHDRVLAAMDGMTEARLVVRPFAHTSVLTHPWFSAPLKLPISLDAVNELRVMTQPLRVRIRYPRPLSEFPGEKVALTLEWLDAPKLDDTQREDASTTFWETAREEYEFTALQPGRYRLAVKAPRAARAELETILVEPGMKPVEVALGRGVTVRARIKQPDFGDMEELPISALMALNRSPFAREVPIAKLFQDGKEIANAALGSENRDVRFPHVAPGKYLLRVLGSEDSREEWPGLPKQNEVGQPATVAWKRKEIPVEVRADSPDVLDAGEIELEKVQLPTR
jgi:hypothetical protein